MDTGGDYPEATEPEGYQRGTRGPPVNVGRDTQAAMQADTSARKPGLIGSTWDLSNLADGKTGRQARDGLSNTEHSGAR